MPLQDVWNRVDGLPCAGAGSWTARCEIGGEQNCWLIRCDGATLRVDTYPRLQSPAAEMAVWYKNDRLFMKDARGMLSEQAFAAEYVKGRIRMIGDREKGRALAEVFKRIGPQIRQIAREAGPQDDDDDGGSASDWLLRVALGVAMWVKKIVDFVSGSLPARPPPALEHNTPFTPAYRGGKSAVPPLALADAQRLPGGGGGGGISDDESEAGSTVSEALARLPWWRRHLGTDILVSAWLWMLGCAMYLVWACIAFFEPVTSYHSLGIRWCELVSSVLFVWGCFYLLKASYPQQLLALAHELSKPPREMGCLEMCVYSNSMLLSTQLFNAGTLPYVGARRRLRAAAAARASPCPSERRRRARLQ